MARNNKKYAYYTIGILRESPTHRAILKDAEEHNTKQIPTLLGIRVSEIYRPRPGGVISVIPSLSPETIKEAEADIDYTESLNNAKASMGLWDD